MFGRRQLPMLVQKLTFLVSGLAFILGVASTYVVPPTGAAVDEEHQVIPADVSEEMAESGDALDLEDELTGWLDHTLLHLHPAPLRGVLGLSPNERTPPSPFLDPLLRPPCLA